VTGDGGTTDNGEMEQVTDVDGDGGTADNGEMELVTGGVGDGETTDNGEMELVTGGVGDGGTTDNGEMELVTGGVGDDAVKGRDSDVLKLLKFSITFIHFYTNLSGLGLFNGQLVVLQNFTSLLVKIFHSNKLTFKILNIKN